MAKRLTKALRGKRRWVGVGVHQRFQDRPSVEKGLEKVQKAMESQPNLRLMDFKTIQQRGALAEQPELTDLPQQDGLAIVRVPHNAIRDIRKLLEEEDAMDKWGFQSLTTSGKIRLVRQRLGLPKPKRK